MDLDTYRELRGLARQHARRESDAEDLVQDTLLAGLAAGRGDLPWLAGTLRNLALMQARSAARRRAREDAAIAEPDDEQAPAMAQDPLARLPPLPPAARRVAVLALHGLAAEEIRWILDLSAAAFRQRLTSIRRALGTLPEAQRREALALAYVRDPARSVDLEFGLLRRALKAALRGVPGLATHDADGHLLVIRTRAHTSASGGNG